LIKRNGMYAFDVVQKRVFHDLSCLFNDCISIVVFTPASFTHLVCSQSELGCQHEYQARPRR
jgi:hypothetical protein